MVQERAEDADDPPGCRQDEDSARATLITDPAGVRAVVERFSTKYGLEYVQPYARKPNVAVDVALA